MRSLAALLAVLLGVIALGIGANAQAPGAASAASAGGGPARQVTLLRIDGPIGPASASYVERGLRRAQERGDALVVLAMDTPGGLDVSMRAIIQAILASPVPVATFVSPAGARAASAGTYILYASHVAAMAPATTLGAATPIAIGGAGGGGSSGSPGIPGSTPGASGAAPPVTAPHDTLEAKRISDAAAYMRSLALLRGRNADWGERAVREAVSLPATEALSQHVVDVVASDVPDLLRQLDGHAVRDVAGHESTLATAGATVVPWEPDWRDRLLAVVGDPSIALLLMLIGFYGLLFEFSNPGLVAPGVVGALCLLLGLYGLQTLPVAGAGIALMLLGLGCFAAEAFVPTHGALGLGGLTAFGLGAVMMLDTRAPGFGISRLWILGLGLVTLVFVMALGAVGLRARRRSPVSGPRTMVGSVGAVLEANGELGWAEVDGERWQVRGARALRAGERVRITRVDGLTLEVE